MGVVWNVQPFNFNCSRSDLRFSWMMSEKYSLTQAPRSTFFRSRRISILWSTQVHGLICKPADQKSSASKSRTVKYPSFSQGPITELYSWWPTDRYLNNQVVFQILFSSFILENIWLLWQGDFWKNLQTENLEINLR